MPGDPTAPVLCIEMAAGTLRHPFPLPPQYDTRCAYVAQIGRLANGATGTWWVEPGRGAEGAAG